MNFIIQCLNYVINYLKEAYIDKYKEDEKTDTNLIEYLEMGEKTENVVLTNLETKLKNKWTTIGEFLESKGKNLIERKQKYINMNRREEGHGGALGIMSFA